MTEQPSGELPAPKRSLHVSDGIVLVVAAALVFSAERTVYWMWRTFSAWFIDVPSWGPAEIRRMVWSLALAEVSLALVLSNLLSPMGRGRLRRGVPGLFVHAAVAFVVAIRLAGWLSQAAVSTLFEGTPGIYGTRWTVEVLNYLRDDLRRDVVIAIVATWLSLAIVGRWNPDRAWDDWLGRILAIVWVLFYLGWQLLGLLPSYEWSNPRGAGGAVGRAPSAVRSGNPRPGRPAVAVPRDRDRRDEPPGEQLRIPSLLLPTTLPARRGAD